MICKFCNQKLKIGYAEKPDEVYVVYLKKGKIIKRKIKNNYKGGVYFCLNCGNNLDEEFQSDEVIIDILENII